MTLTLRAVSLNEQPLSQAITAHFDAQGGSIGRADHNTLALPDPERHISRKQAEISTDGRHYAIRNVGSANPIGVGSRLLARGESAPLAHRDQVRIGGYLLEVTEENADDGEASTIARGRAAVDARTPSRANAPIGLPAAPSPTAPVQTGGAAGRVSGSNPFADLLGDVTPSADAGEATPLPGASSPRLADAWADPPPSPAGVSASSTAWAPPAAAEPHARLPDDFDPFAAPAPARARAPIQPAPGSNAGASVFGDLISSPEPTIDEWLAVRPGQRDPLADFMADMPPGGPPAAGDAAAKVPGVSTDPLAMFRNTAGAAANNGAQATRADDVPELQAAFKPPSAVRITRGMTEAFAVSDPGHVADQVSAQSAEPAPSRDAPAAPSLRAPAPSEPQALWAAFCEGAGIPVAADRPLDAEQMRIIGKLLRSAVEGTLQLVMVRATTKHELRAPVTMIQSRNNNPLKFSPDAGSALEQLLQPPMRGFLDGPAAMTDAMHDLVGHTIGTMAGTRAALEGVLDRFTPQQLETKLVAHTMLDSVLPMKRKAKLWELYLKHFEAIRTEAQEDFHTLFGKAFLAAYEQQLDRLKRDVPGNV